MHGAVANRKAWLPLARLAEREFEMWCPDLPGHGSRRAEPFTLASALETVGQLIEIAAPRRPIVVGDSLGGYVALLAAERFGERCAGVVASGCTWTMTGWWGTLARASDILPASIERAAGSGRVVAAVAPILWWLTDAATAEAMYEAGLRLAARSESLRELAGLDLAAVVRAIRIPLGFANGAFDWPTRLGEPMLLRANPRATLTLAYGCGHGMGLLAPRVMLAVIRGVAEAGRAWSQAPHAG